MALPTLDATFASSADLPRKQMLAKWLIEELGSGSIADYYNLPERHLWAKIAVAVGAPKTEADYISLPIEYVLGDIYASVVNSGPRPLSINPVGQETGSPSNNYSVQNWSNSNVVKLYDISSSERYGVSGYYQIRPTLNSAPSNIFQAVGNGNNLGISEASNPTLFSKPSFINSITGYAGNYVNFSGYSLYVGPNGSTIYRQGALSVSVNQGPFNTPSGSNNGYFGQVVQFSLNSTASFRIGFTVDSVGSSSFAPNYVSIFNSSIGTVFSQSITRDTNSDIVFFDVVGNSGDFFDVALWQLTGTQSVAALSLITFDSIPQAPVSGEVVANEAYGLGRIVAAYRGDTENPQNLATYIDWPWRYKVASIIQAL